MIQTRDLEPETTTSRSQPKLPGRSRPSRLIATLVISNLLIPIHTLWVARSLLLIILLTLPGVLIVTALRVPRGRISRFPIYIPLASVAYLLLLSGAVDLIALGLGIKAPLRSTVLLTVGLDLTLLPLALLRREECVTADIVTGLPFRWVAALLVIPVLSAAGATRLNNGYGSAVATIALVLVIATMAVCLILANRLSVSVLAVALTTCSLGLLWGFSLRGNWPIGYDISTEIAEAQQTIAAGAWHSSHTNDAYGAMLSVTTLPALLSRLLGISAATSFKVIYPMLFSVVPAAVFFLAHRVVRKRAAFGAGGFLLAQSYFFENMPTLARQEIGILAFLGLVAVLFEGSRESWALLLGGLFSIAMIVSHYSTTYLALATLLVACAIDVLVRTTRRSGLSDVLPRISILLVTLLGAAIWYGPVTHSANNLRQLGSSLNQNGLDLLPNSNGNLVDRYLKGNSPVSVSAQAYEAEIAKEYRIEHPLIRPFPAAAAPKFALADASTPTPRERLAPVASMLSSVELGLQQAGNLFAVLGTLLMALCLRRNRRRAAPDSGVLSPLTGPAAREAALLSGASILALAVIRLSGTVATSYNQERAFVQLFIPLSLALAFMLQRIYWLARRSRLVPLVAGISLLLMLVFLSGLSSVITGGNQTVNVANSGEDFERFYVLDQEVAAARWFGKNAPKDMPLYSDRYGQLRLIAYANRTPPFPDLTPKTLNTSAWIYLTYTNNVLGRSRGQTGLNRVAEYITPKGFLNDYYPLVYDNGSAEVYGS